MDVISFTFNWKSSASVLQKQFRQSPEHPEKIHFQRRAARFQPSQAWIMLTLPLDHDSRCRYSESDQKVHISTLNLFLYNRRHEASSSNKGLRQLP